MEEEARGEGGKRGTTEDTVDSKRGRNGGKDNEGAGKKKVESIRKNAELKEGAPVASPRVVLSSRVTKSGARTLAMLFPGAFQ